MNLTAERYTIVLPRPFRIAHGVSATRDTILVHLRDEDGEGHGEGALPPYYPSQAGACLAWLDGLRIDDLREDLPPAPPEAAAARVALEIAWQDLAAQRAGEPLWKRLGATSQECPRCPTTFSIPQNASELDAMIDEAVAGGSRCFKLKSGSGDISWDEACARQVRQRVPDARLCLDANAGWQPAEAAALIARLEDVKIEFFEQPVGRERSCWVDLRAALRETPALLVADESVQTLGDLGALRGLADGVNIKLLKAGGLQPARAWIERARELELKVMIGVMVETGIGRTAAAQLAPLADWLDIDPPASIPVAPLSGFAVEGDRLILSDRPGLGLRANVR